MIHVLAEAEENINNAVEEKHKQNEVNLVVELDQFKYTLSTYEKPLKEVGDSL